MYEPGRLTTETYVIDFGAEIVELEPFTTTIADVQQWKAVMCLQTEAKATEPLNWGIVDHHLEISKTRRAAGLSIVTMMHGQGAGKASDNALTEVIDAVYELAANLDYSEINAVLKAADLPSLAPEFLVGLPRVTCRWRSRLPFWDSFLNGAIDQLKIRGGFNLTALFHGITPVPL